MAGIAAVQTRADQVVGTNAGETQRLARRCLKLHFLAQLQLGQGGLSGIDFITEDPQMASANASFGIMFETQAWQCHGVLRVGFS